MEEPQIGWGAGESGRVDPIAARSRSRGLAEPRTRGAEDSRLPHGRSPNNILPPGVIGRPGHNRMGEPPGPRGWRSS